MSFLPAASPSCPACKASLEGAVVWADDAPPEPGDVTICNRCFALLVYADGGGLRAPTDEEYREVALDPVLSRRIGAYLERRAGS